MRINRITVLLFIVSSFIIFFTWFFSFTTINSLEEDYFEFIEEKSDALIYLGEMKSDILFLKSELFEYSVNPTQFHIDHIEKSKEDLVAAYLLYEVSEGEDEEEELKVINDGILTMIDKVDRIFEIADIGITLELSEELELLDELSHFLVEYIDEELVKDWQEQKDAGIIVQNDIHNTSLLLGVLTFSTLFVVSGGVVLFQRSLEKNVETEKLELMSKVVKNVGHDLRNPLSSISASAYVLKDASGEKKQKMLNIINDSVISMDVMLKSFLNYDKELELYLYKMDISSVIEQILDGFVTPDNIEIIFNKKDVFLVNVDVEKIKRVFLNLIMNSVQAMPDGGKISIITEIRDNAVRISFTDTGKGIAKENLKKIFTAFYTSKSSGLGLGLVNVKNIVESHKGSIKVESIEGKGTTMIISLPLVS